MELHSNPSLTSQEVPGWSQRGKARGFTLLELLAVVAIIGLLAALLFPAVSGTRKRAETASCVSRMRAIMAAELSYSSDNDGFMVSEELGTAHIGWVKFLAPYATDRDWDPKKNEWICCPASKKKDGAYKISGIGPVLATNKDTHLNPVHGESQYQAAGQDSVLDGCQRRKLRWLSRVLPGVCPKRKVIRGVKSDRRPEQLQ